jgi:mandelate racemase
MPDLMRIAGVSGWLKAAAIAGAAGVPISTHLYPEFAAHLMRVTETADWLEWRAWAEPILQMRYDIRDGLLHIRRRPGMERRRGGCKSGYPLGSGSRHKQG